MEYHELLNLLRETVMRAHFALPETDQDVEWFDDPVTDPEFIEQVYKVLNLGNHERNRNSNS